jgi:predicted transcriptional regulator of viral defense system
MNVKKPIVFPFPDRKYVRTTDLFEKNLSYYMINRLVNEGMIAKINGSTYQNLTYSGNESDFLAVSAYLENGVVCLMSAAVYHGMSTVRTSQVDVGVSQKSKIGILPAWPAIGVFYFDRARFETGVQTIDIEGGSFRIYDREKTVCDLLTYRNKYGLEDCLAVLKTYLRRSDRDINKLIAYAEKLKSLHILSKYLEVLL